MEALYDFLPVPGTKNSEKSPKLYPKLVTRGAVPFSEIIRQIARSSGFKEGTVIGVMEEVEKWTSFYISRGECVEIGHMAYAVANLKAGKEITDEGEIHAQTIRFDKVRFRTSKSFNRRCRTGTFPSQDRMEIPEKFLPIHGRGTPAPAHGVSKAASVHHKDRIRSADRTSEIKSLEGPERMGKKQDIRKQRKSSPQNLYTSTGDYFDSNRRLR